METRSDMPPIAKPFGALLIANRGEIACRIIRTARRMGIRTVAVFSAADADALHVSMADQAILIGPPPARESYLDIAKIVAAAKATGAEAVHPGYGFLSENADFAEACARAGLVFVGPTAASIRAMGSKSSAKALMEAAGVPLVPGCPGDAQDVETLANEADHIGYPVLVKAVAGGGGKGMRIAESNGRFAEALGAAKREAKAAFGNDDVLIEKYIVKPRHIEVQVFGDTHGNVVSLFERECTLQRRHQKVVEEAPAASLSEEEREKICAVARIAAKAVDYVGAGTVEFVANDDGFHFIEMNTRLQVEHPVTEMITGLDLVEWQLRVAAGEPLPLRQDQIVRHGHAFEVRIYAEDPDTGFLPSIGKILAWRQPEADADIRIDTGFRAGDTVSPHYDPLIAKLIVRGEDRLQTLHRLEQALDGFQLTGLKTNVAFLQALIAHADVRRGDMDTGLIERELAGLLVGQDVTDRDMAAAVAGALQRERVAAMEPLSPWDAQDGWMIAGRRCRTFAFTAPGGDHAASLIYRRSGLMLDIGDSIVPFRVSWRDDGRIDVFHGDVKETVSAAWAGDDLELVTPRGRIRLNLADPFAGDEDMSAAIGHFRAPMPGAIRQILAAPGDFLKGGDPVLILEAMKMEHTLRAPADGTVTALRCAVGDFVEEGTELVEFETSAG